MAYSLYLDGVLYPVAPAKVKTGINNQNETMHLIDGGEINFLRTAGLTDIQFDLLLPQVRYPFAVYAGGFLPADYFIEQLEMLKAKQKPFRFILSRVSPGGKLLFDTNLSVSLEDYDFTDDAQNGIDITVSIKLKQYRDYATKTVVLAKKKASVKVARKSATVDTKQKTHTVVKGDCLWNIAQAYMGDGSKYPALYAANQAVIDGKNKGTGNPKYTIYSGQVLKIP